MVIRGFPLAAAQDSGHNGLRTTMHGSSVRPAPSLRLVGTMPVRALRDVEAENRSAAAIPYSDARWIFAADVAKSLEGGKAAILRPARRRSLVAKAVKCGLRPFDANLVIAVVQEGVRSGAGSLGRATAERLAIIPAPVKPAGWSPVWRIAISLALGSAMAMMLARLFATH